MDRVLAQPFGSRRDPVKWGMVVTFLLFIACGILHITTSAFPGDVFCVGSHRVAMGVFLAFRRPCEIIGFPTSDKKGRPPSVKMVLLGADVSIRDTHIRAEIRAIGRQISRHTSPMRYKRTV